MHGDNPPYLAYLISHPEDSCNSSCDFSCSLSERSRRARSVQAFPFRAYPLHTAFCHYYVYLLLTLPFDIVRSRTPWIGGATKPVGASFTSALSIKLIVIIAEATEKRSIFLAHNRYSSPEVTSESIVRVSSAS